MPHVPTRSEVLALAAAGALAFATVGTSGQPPRKPPVHDVEGRLEFYRQHEAMKATSPFRDLEWEFLGPQVMSGRVTGIAVPPGSRYTMYVATASGGVWKTENEATTWEPIFENAPSQSIGAIAVAPSNPDHVWVGGGEANIFRSSMSGVGIHFSPDGGDTWEHKGLGETGQIARIVVHPDDPDTVWVAGAGKEWSHDPERGVFKTTDGGETWNKTLYVDERTGAYDLRIDPRDPEVLYAATWERIRLKWMDPKPGPGTSIYKSTDGGESWREIDSGLPADRSKRGRIGIDIARSDPDVLYAFVDNHEIDRDAGDAGKTERDAYGRERQDVIKGAEVYRTSDGGETWEKRNSPSELLARNNATYGWVFGQIRVDPGDEDTVYVLGVSILKSTDGGRKFQRLSYDGLHVDHHALWIDPDDGDHVIDGNDGGIDISYDGGETWKNVENLPVVQFYNVGHDMQEPFWVYGSIQDNRSWRGPVRLCSRQRQERERRQQRHDGGSAGGSVDDFRCRRSVDAWIPAPGGEASYHAVDPYDPEVVFSSGFYGRIQRTIDGETETIAPEAAGGEPEMRGQWLAPFILSPHDPRVVYHGFQYVHRSPDRGGTWERISPDLTYNDPDRMGDIPFQTITTLDESPLRPGLLYVGTDDGRSWMTPDDGETWNELTEEVVPGKWVSRVTASRFDECAAYMAQNGKRDHDYQAYLWRTADCGATWEDIAVALPGGPINVVEEDPKVEGLLYVGTDLGLYASIDGGDSWQVVANGLPNTFVHDLIVHPRDDILVIATHGRGMFAMDARPIQARARE